jgi:glycosyltransferase involved in cell wall biosynthesis
MDNILFVHQSAELYGSDKTLLYLVSRLRERGFNPIVVLPFKGPLYTELKKSGVEIIIAPVIKISRNMFSFTNLVSLPVQIFRSFSLIRKHLAGRKVTLVHSNTLAVLIGALFAKRYDIRHLWHVHEIIAHPKSISDLYPKIVDYFSDIAVFNSKASMDYMLQKRPKLASKSKVVLNGLDRTAPPTSPQDIESFRRSEFNASAETVVIALVGRISRWKGQQLLLNAFQKLQHKADVRLVFVGSPPPNQEIFLDSLNEKINEYGLSDKVFIFPFRNDIWTVWDSIDIAAVPSTEPEPFGLVAIEAMLASKPVVGANHGGLTEIIIDGKTGILFEPGNENALHGSLEILVKNKALRETMGSEGHRRATEQFSLKRYVGDFEKLYH